MDGAVGRRIGVGIIGAGWMGHVHARSYQRLAHHFPELPRRPHLVAVADSLEAPGQDLAGRFGVARRYRDPADLIADPQVEAVSVTAPNGLHRQLGVAVAEAGKHLWIEKPVGLGAADARAVADAVSAAGVVATVGFNYRNAPAVEHARALIARGDVGTVTHARVHLLSDYAAHPRGALSWRFERARGGAGVLGDLASHGVDLLRYLLGDVEALVAATAVFIPRRPLGVEGASHFAIDDAPGAQPAASAAVENEDYVAALVRTAAGALVTLEASRVCVGAQNHYGFEIHGTRGLLRWDFRRLGELQVSAGDRYQDQQVTTVFAGPGQGGYAAFQPGAGIAMGYDDLKVIEAERFVRAIAGPVSRADAGPTPADAGPTLADAVAAAEALEAMQESARTETWVRLGGRGS